MRSWSFPALLAAVLLCAPASMSAQAPAALTKGRASLAIDLPDARAGRISIWRFVSGRTNVGAVLGFSARESKYDDYPDSRTIGIDIGPAVKRYFSPKPRVAPFIRADASFGFYHTSMDETPTRPAEIRNDYFVRADLGLGVDWFATDDISLGAHTGVGTFWRISDSTTDASEWGISTFSSALSLHIYF